MTTTAETQTIYPESGNPLMGPFLLEGAEYGDALDVHSPPVPSQKVE
jgi:hypothetical protein